jgi:exopolysaccharide production protein ExoZ
LRETASKRVRKAHPLSALVVNTEDESIMRLNEGGDGRSTQFRGIQVLSGIAALMVVIHHATQMWSQTAAGVAKLPVWWTGAAGVDIFFVISGFVMAASTIGREHKTHPARSFLERRLIRIMPLYWIVSTVLLLKIAAVKLHPQFAGSGVHEPTPFAYIAASLLLIPYRDAVGNAQPLLIVGWTLSYEMFFYLLFTLALALRLRVVYLLAPLMVALVVAGSFRGAASPAILTLTDPILLEFLAGLVLGHFVVQGFRINGPISALLGALGLVLLLIPSQTAAPGFRVLQWGVPATLFVLSFVMLETSVGHGWPRWALLLGDASYSLYLWHLLILTLLLRLLTKQRVMTMLARPHGELLAIFVLFSGAVLISLFLYLLLEKPLTKTLRRTLSSKSES